MTSRIVFRLSMPSRGSWNGDWSGASKNYLIVKTLTDKQVVALLGDKSDGSWWHAWTDGWAARVDARITRSGERLSKSDGFCGYDWMVNNILDHGDTQDRKKENIPA